MIRHHLVRLAVTVAAAALTVPALAPAATAASTPSVPTLAAAAKVYPHLSGGSFYESPTDKVYGPGKKCDQTKRIKGATGNSAAYLAPNTSSTTGAAPGLTVIAYRLPSAAKAKSLLSSSAQKVKKCKGGGVVIPGVKSTKVKKLKVKLGDTSTGYTVTVKTDDATYINNMILVRKGKHIVMALVSSMDGVVPSVKKTVEVTKLALKTAS